MTLPPLEWKPSPNFNSRHGARVDLLVLHDCQGYYQGSIETFLGNNGGNPVSAHFVAREDGSEVTQMVALADRAWHCVDFNSRSVGYELAGFAARGYAEAELETAANAFAWLAHRLQIPIVHARAGVGPGICSHYDLGRLGGSHTDPSTDPQFMPSFIARIEAAAAPANDGGRCR